MPITTGNTGGDVVNHPPHYNAHPSGVEAIEVCRLMPFTTGNAVKYIWRFEDRNGLEDLSKARWYLQDHLSNGSAWRPPYRASKMLLQVAAADTNDVRAQLLRLIAHGGLREAVAVIHEVLEAGNA